MLGEIVGGQRIVARIGEGRAGVVYRARDLALDRPTAIKILRRAGARQELPRHRNIVEVLGSGVDRDVAYVVMELLEGESLERRLAREGAIAAAVAERIAGDVADALAAAHRAGVVHGDLEPGDVFVAADRARLLDFPPPSRGATRRDDLDALHDIAARMTGGRAGLPRRAFLGLAGAAAATAAASTAGCLGRAGPPRRAPRLPYRRLAKDPTPLVPDRPDFHAAYDVVVVGSGYGGSILAARLAPGRRLAVLERGAEWPPGAFPESAAALRDQIRTGDRPLGLFDLRVFEDQSVLVGCGVGGTSLINANVVIEPDPEVLGRDVWPDEIRGDHDAGRLEALYGVVRDMLGAARHPTGAPRKMRAFAAAARSAGGRVRRARVAVNFDRYDDEPNHAGAWQRRCTQCGNCVSGCNVTAKNTLNLNYLPLARSRGADIYAGVEVEWLEKRGRGWIVGGVTRTDGPARRVRIFAGAVVLGAGSLGSTEILLRSRARGLALSDALGDGVSGNADVLAIAYNSDVRTDTVGFGTRTRRFADVGPTIGMIGDFGEFLIEEAAIPSGLTGTLRRVVGLVPAMDGLRPDSASQAAARVKRAALDVGRFDSDGALNHSLVLLGMGHDPSPGTLRLDDDGALQLAWKPSALDRTVDHITAKMRAISAALGGIFILDPTSRGWLDRDITVHPLGGCRMGADAGRGVVDHLGRVFDPRSAGAVHDGLYVADGAILPTSAGVNPLLLISALAERIAAHAAEALP